MLTLIMEMMLGYFRYMQLMMVILQCLMIRNMMFGKKVMASMIINQAQIFTGTKIVKPLLE